MLSTVHTALDTQSPPDGATLPATIVDPVPMSVASLANLGLTDAECDAQSAPGQAKQLATAQLKFGTDVNHGRGENQHDALLLILADALDDLERVRIATDNRLRSLGQVKGLAGSREAQTMAQVSETLAALEHKATLDLQRAMRAHPMGPWVKRTIGIGEKQAARLLAAIGDPADRKMPSQLWQYCGHGEPSKRQRGVKTFWNPTAKMRLHLMAESCIKQTGKPSANVETQSSAVSRSASPYRKVYLEAKAGWEDRDTTKMHKHNHALRMVGKAILLDMWIEARKLRDQ